jgi:hypothetical protein
MLTPTDANRGSDRPRLILESRTLDTTCADVSMNNPPLRLAFGAVFGRLFLVVFSIQLFIAFQKSRQLLRSASPWKKLAAFLDFSPYALILGFLLAALITVALDLLVRLVGRALSASWYAHRETGREYTPLAFSLAPGERLVAESPARRASARGWRPGTLVLTDKRLAFFPVDWDIDPWSVPRQALSSLRVEPSRAALGSLIEGVPGRLIARDTDARETAFALADPAGPLAWFAPPMPVVPAS